MKTVECQSQVHVDGKVWFCAFTVQTCGVEGPVPRGRCPQWEVGVLMPALRITGSLVQAHAAGLPLGIQTWVVASEVSECAWREWV